MIRQITKEDREKIQVLYKQLHPDQLKEVDLSNTNFKAEYFPLVFDDAGQITGFLTLVILKIGRSPIAYIEDVIVDKAHRRRGIGTKLVKAALLKCQECQVSAFFVSTDFQIPEEDPSAFYQKLGFHKMNSPWFVKSLELTNV